MSALEMSIVACRQAAEAAGYGAAAPAAGATESALRALEQVVHPRRLPDDLRTLVRTWNFGCEANGLIFPGFGCDAGFVGSGLDEFAEWPRALVPIAYQSHCFLLMELDFDGTTGPAIFTFEWAGDGVRLLARSLAAVFDWIAEQFVGLSAGLLPEGIPEIGRAMRRPISGPDSQTIDYYQISTWPIRWQHEQGVTAEMYRLRGATHTVADFEAARRQGHVKATLVGDVRNLSGSGAGSLRRLTDHTGAAEFFVPIGVPSLETSSTSRYEVDVVARPLQTPEVRMEDLRSDHHEVQRRALSGDVSGAAQASVPLHNHLLGDHPVVATAVRAVTAE